MVFAVLFQHCRSSAATLTRANLFLAFISSVVTTDMASHTERCGSAMRDLRLATS